MHPIGYGQEPDCCSKCKNLESDSNDEYSPNYYYCTLGMKIPTKKLTCKRMPAKTEHEMLEVRK